MAPHPKQNSPWEPPRRRTHPTVKSKPHPSTATPAPNPPTPPAPDWQTHTGPSSSSPPPAGPPGHETPAAKPGRCTNRHPGVRASSSPSPSARNATNQVTPQAPSTNARDPASPPSTMSSHRHPWRRSHAQNNVRPEENRIHAADHGMRPLVRPVNLTKPPDAQTMLLRKSHDKSAQPIAESWPASASRASTLLQILTHSTVGACLQANGIARGGSPANRPLRRGIANRYEAPHKEKPRH